MALRRRGRGRTTGGEVGVTTPGVAGGAGIAWTVSGTDVGDCDCGGGSGVVSCVLVQVALIEAVVVFGAAAVAGVLL